MAAGNSAILAIPIVLFLSRLVGRLSTASVATGRVLGPAILLRTICSGSANERISENFCSVTRVDTHRDQSFILLIGLQLTVLAKVSRSRDQM